MVEFIMLVAISGLVALASAMMGGRGRGRGRKASSRDPLRHTRSNPTKVTGAQPSVTFEQAPPSRPRQLPSAQSIAQCSDKQLLAEIVKRGLVPPEALNASHAPTGSGGEPPPDDPPIAALRALHLGERVYCHGLPPTSCYVQMYARWWRPPSSSTD